MDAFYASVEMARHPALRDVPMFVGGSTRGVVLSANYPARRFGIGAGMPSSRARRLCPQVAVVHPDFDHYSAVSDGVSEIFDTLTDRVEMVSIDEAFIDLTTALRRLGGDPVAIGERLRAQVMDEQGIACSVGIGPSKFIAKLASKQAKPDGLVRVLPADTIAFLHPLPVEAIWGWGRPPRESCTASASTRCATWPTRRGPPCSGRSATGRARCCSTWRGGVTTGR
ncbi:Y-family DNA polymerase [Tessaracoccus coleopterorum]|uniref:Y-family DNA polymerase n=1 Tax=Tessaracoccus coleopterorum TaxID=2714950 RepID=UPI001E38436C|nr:DNA polymerase IV [Tessaracoccus coleopterorum]